MLRTSFLAFTHNFLGNSPQWFKISLISFLILNPILLYATGPYVTGWIFVIEFIFILAMALQCYPLPPAGLLALQAVILRLTSAESVYKEVAMNLPVILLLVFMVAAIYFMKDFLRVVFTSILLRVRSKVVLSLLFLLSAAFLSAFLDALTVTAVIISVAYGFYDLYHRYVSGKHDIPCDLTDDSQCREESRIDLQEFRGFLRNLVMHAAVGTALGGVATLVGEPQNLLIATVMNWDFATFFFKVAPVSMPVLAMGIVTCLVLERLHLFGYGRIMSESVRYVLQKQSENEARQRSARAKARLAIQAVGGVFLILALGFHLAEVGLIGLTLLVLLTALNGINEEHRIGRAFEEALPFTSLLVVFFCIVAVIHDQHLFRPVTQFVLTLDGQKQLAAYYLANGFLSMISDNVFVATVYISEAAEAFKAGAINREQFDLLAVAINTGTNIPSVATPNGQAAFLFLLTSALAPVIRLSYGRMVLLALPYTVTMTLTGLAAIWWFL